jgi:teichuronic acid biosynthesis glycosyltransferase TuaG
MTLISIITPYFKKKKNIKETITSILNQTYQNFEIFIIYDDEDKTDLNYIKQIQKLDKRINLIINQKNMGAGNSRNIGIKFSRGEYLAFIDSDDQWSKEKLNDQLNFMKSQNLKITHTSYNIIDENNKIISFRIARNFIITTDLLKSCDIGLSTVMLKKEIIDEYCCFANIKTKEDFVLWLKILEKNHEIIGLDKKLTNWKKLNNSLSSSVIQKILDGYRVYYKYMNFGIFKSLYYLLCLSINSLKK